MPDVIVTPHCSGLTARTFRRADDDFVADLARWTRHEPLTGVTADELASSPPGAGSRRALTRTSPASRSAGT